MKSRQNGVPIAWNETGSRLSAVRFSREGAPPAPPTRRNGPITSEFGKNRSGEASPCDCTDFFFVCGS